MNTIRVIRKDSTTPVTYPRVKHAWRQGDELVLSMGQHGRDRVYVHWPIGHIDHYEVEETADSEIPGRHE